MVAQMVKNLPAMSETWVQSPGQEGPLEKRMASHSSILTWRIPWTEEPGRVLAGAWQSPWGHEWLTHKNIETFINWSLLYILISCFPLMPFFCPGTPPRIPHDILSLHLFKVLCAGMASQTLLVFDDLDHFEECWSALWLVQGSSNEVPQTEGLKTTEM